MLAWRRERIAPLARGRGQRSAGAVAPDLSAGRGVVVDHDDRCAARRGSDCRRHAGRARADDQHIAMFERRHSEVSTRMPSPQTVWHASLRRPSIEHAAFLAHAHAAERRARLARDGGARHAHAARDAQCGGDRTARLHAHEVAVDVQQGVGAHAISSRPRGA
jgi:ABC-type Fe2+-enterobactin transport system substrate-binding protein